jgi:hypothetical protein
MPLANRRLPVNRCIVNRNIAPLGFTMKLFTATYGNNLGRQIKLETGFTGSSYVERKTGGYD